MIDVSRSIETGTPLKRVPIGKPDWFPRLQAACRRLASAPASIVAATLMLAACAATAPDPHPSCVDLTGTYENSSPVNDVILASFFFEKTVRAVSVALRSGEGPTLTVTAAGREVSLAGERDFSCFPDGIRLVKTDTRNIALPPLIVQEQTVYYVFTKADDGSLRMTPHFQTKGTTFGLPIAARGEKLGREITWRAVR